MLKRGLKCIKPKTSQLQHIIIHNVLTTRILYFPTSRSSKRRAPEFRIGVNHHSCEINPGMADLRFLSKNGQIQEPSSMMRKSVLKWKKGGASGLESRKIGDLRSSRGPQVSLTNRETVKTAKIGPNRAFFNKIFD